VLDFTNAGYPSTYLLDETELMNIFRTLVSHLQQADPDYILLEIADGIFQPETKVLLENDELRTAVKHVIFTAGDSAAAECGVRRLQELGWPVLASAGMLTQSPLAIREAEQVTGLPCLSIDRMMSGEIQQLIQKFDSVPVVPLSGEARSCQAHELLHFEPKIASL